MSTHAPFRRYDSVQQDWRAFLPDAKAEFYYTHTGELENAYVPFSMSLNEALELLLRRLSVQAFETIAIAPELCSRLALRISSVLHCMRQHGRHFGILPNFAPLDCKNFQTDHSLRAVRSGNLLSRILLSRHAQFLQKILTLERVVDALDAQFANAVCQLNQGGADSPELWETLSQCQFDLNTCLRETNVLLKSFLFALPEAHLPGLDFTIRGLCRSRHVFHESAVSVLRPRRMSVSAGK